MNNIILTVSIVHFNTPEVTKKCLISLMDILDRSPLSGRYEISIIDNRSVIEKYRVLEEFVAKKNRKEIVLRRNCMNSGFGLGCMLTLNNSSSKYIVFVNSDTFFYEDCFSPLIEIMEEIPAIGMLTPQHKDEAGNSIRSYGYFESIISRIFGISCFNKKPRELSFSDKNLIEVDFAYGCFMLVRRDAFAIAGGFDPNIFLYYEEMDLCWRLKKAGYLTCVFDKVGFRHVGGASGRGESLRFESFLSMVYVVKKQKGAIYGLLFYIGCLIQLLCKAPFKSRNRRAFWNFLGAWSPQSISMRNSQKCEFID